MDNQIGGVLYTADYADCGIIDATTVHGIFYDALFLAKATTIEKTGAFHVFDNGGMSASVLLRESHAAIHTWPEGNFVTFELFTCGETVNALTAINYLAEQLKCIKYDTNRHSRFPANARIPN